MNKAHIMHLFTRKLALAIPVSPGRFLSTRRFLLMQTHLHNYTLITFSSSCPNYLLEHTWRQNYDSMPLPTDKIIQADNQPNYESLLI